MEIPATWDEYVQVCETLKAAGVTPVGLMGKDPGRVGHTFQCQTVAFKTEYSFNYTLVFSAYLLAMLPMLIIYCLGQKYIIRGLTAGSVKG